jgi:hypothetical protein
VVEVAATVPAAEVTLLAAEPPAELAPPTADPPATDTVDTTWAADAELEDAPWACAAATAVVWATVAVVTTSPLDSLAAAGDCWAATEGREVEVTVTTPAAAAVEVLGWEAASDELIGVRDEGSAEATGTTAAAAEVVGEMDDDGESATGVDDWAEGDSLNRIGNEESCRTWHGTDKVACNAGWIRAKRFVKTKEKPDRIRVVLTRHKFTITIRTWQQRQH